MSNELRNGERVEIVITTKPLVRVVACPCCGQQYDGVFLGLRLHCVKCFADIWPVEQEQSPTM